MFKNTDRALGFFNPGFFAFFLFLTVISAFSPGISRAAEDNDFNFAVIGCFHFGLTPAKDYILTLNNIKYHEPSFIAFTGGMVDPLVKDDIKELWREFSSINQKKAGVPIYDVFGSCSVHNLVIPQARRDEIKNNFNANQKKTYYFNVYKNNLFIFLDSDNLFDKKNNQEQIDFLKNIIDNASNYNNIFIFMHRSLWLEDENWWFNSIHPIIKGKAKWVFGSGLHIYKNKNLDNVNYISFGLPVVDAGSPRTKLHYLLVEIHEKKVLISVIFIRNVQVPVIDNPRLEEIFKHESGDPRDFFADKLKKSYLSDPERTASLQPCLVAKKMRIQPGMNIVDIGSGAGIFTFAFAEALKGAGKVFATDIDREWIKYINDNAKIQGYTNVYPVLVQPSGVDSFYKDNIFDIIFLCELFNGIDHRESYFNELRPFLKKESGRLYILSLKDVYDYTGSEFGDYKRLLNQLVNYDNLSPVLKRLSQKSQEFVAKWKGEDIPVDMRSQITQDLNKMLNDRSLYRSIVGDCSIYQYKDFRQLELRELVRWLEVDLEGKGAFDDRAENISADEIIAFKLLNKILLTELFGFRNFFARQEHIIGLRKKTIIKNMENAGFKLVNDYDVLNYHYFLEFKRKY